MNASTPTGLPAVTFNRILEEGYGPGAWYGSDLRAAVTEATPATAFTRPATGRHNIAEVALHRLARPNASTWSSASRGMPLTMPVRFS